MIRPLLPVPAVADLVAEMDRAGIEKALTWHIVQCDGSPQVGNRLLTEAIADQPRLFGCWALMPNQADEFPRPPALFVRMAENRIRAIRVFPEQHKFLLNTVTMGEVLRPMAERRIPLLLSVRRGVQWRDIYDILAEIPSLVCVICDHGCWGMDRQFRPLLERYPNVYVDTAQYLLDGGIEALVASYGPERLLFGSGFPESYHGGMMLALKHAKIPEDAKAAVAADNIERILSEAEL